jgi:hypothetical protein
MPYIYKIHLHTKFQKSILKDLSMASTSEFQGHHITINDDTLLLFVAYLTTISVTQTTYPRGRT